MLYTGFAINRRLAKFFAFLFAVSVLTTGNLCRAATPASPDVVILTNGDRITGTFVREVRGTVTFHSPILGNLEIPTAKVASLSTHAAMAVIPKGVTLKHGHPPSDIPIGTLTIRDHLITVHPANHAMIQPIPLVNAEYIIGKDTFNKQILGHPNFFEGWNGAATLGMTVVQATENQFTFTGSLGLTRVVPTVDWLAPRNRTTVGYSESYGKITQPAYTAADGTAVAATETKSSILHVGVERDQYVSPRFYYLGTASFDHNYSQSLQLQQIYGGGFGYTVLKSPVQELDVKAVVQYERQAFFNVTPPSPAHQSLIASTFGGTYVRHMAAGMLFTQQLLYIPAWNNLHAYSVNESDTLMFPVYKNFGFSIGTLDTYLNNVPLTFPNTKRNSFQFTAGVTYNIKSSY